MAPNMRGEAATHTPPRSSSLPASISPPRLRDHASSDEDDIGPDIREYIRSLPTHVDLEGYIAKIMDSHRAEMRALSENIKHVGDRVDTLETAHEATLTKQDTYRGAIAHNSNQISEYLNCI